MTELGRSVGGEVASWARAHATGAALAAYINFRFYNGAMGTDH